MNKFLVLNPELRELVGDKRAEFIGKKIDSFKVNVNTIDCSFEKVFIQPQGHCLVISIFKDGNKIRYCNSCEVPLDLDCAEYFVSYVDGSESRDFIMPGEMEDFPRFRLDYFQRKGKTLEAQVQHHNELIQADLIDAVVQVYELEVGRASLIEIHAGKRFCGFHE